MSETTWYYRMLGVEFGPVSRSALVEMVRLGQLGAEDAVRCGDSGEWIAPSELLESAPPLAGAEDLAMLVDEPASERRRPLRLNEVTLGEDAGGEPASRPQPEERWLCRVRGRQIGPLEFCVMAELARAGVLSPTDRVRPASEPKWVLAESLEGLAFEPSTPSAEARSPSGHLSPQRGAVPSSHGATPGPRGRVAGNRPSTAAGQTPPSRLPGSGERAETRQATPPEKNGTEREVVANSRRAPAPGTDPAPLRASASLGTSPPRTPLARYQPPVPPPRGRRTSSFSLDELLIGPVVKYAAFAIVGVAVLGLGYWQFGASIGLRKGDRYYYDLAQGLYFAAKQAEDPARLKLMGKQMAPIMEEITEGTETRAELGDDVAKALFQCSRELFPKLFNGNPREREKNLQPIEAALKVAQRELEG